jgi:hypothetical protein
MRADGNPVCTPRYNLVAIAPSSRGNETVLLLSCQGEMHRSGDGGLSWSEVMVPALNYSLIRCKVTPQCTTVHSIVFSPSFADDHTAYISGFNIGVAVSRDGGRTFAPVWDATGAVTAGSNVKVVLSPTYATDGTLLATVATRIPPAGCKEIETFEVHSGAFGTDGKACYAAWRGGAGAILHMSTVCAHHTATLLPPHTAATCCHPTLLPCTLLSC